MECDIGDIPSRHLSGSVPLKKRKFGFLFENGRSEIRTSGSGYSAMSGSVKTSCLPSRSFIGCRNDLQGRSSLSAGTTRLESACSPSISCHVPCWKDSVPHIPSKPLLQKHDHQSVGNNLSFVRRESTLTSSSQSMPSNSADEIYLNINGRKYIARPFEEQKPTNCQDSKSKGNQGRCLQETGSRYHDKGTCGESRISLYAGDANMVNNVEFDRSPSDVVMDQTETLEQVILRDKLRHLGKMQAVQAASVSIGGQSPEHDSDLESLSSVDLLSPGACTPKSVPQSPGSSGSPQDVHRPFTSHQPSSTCCPTYSDSKTTSVSSSCCLSSLSSTSSSSSSVTSQADIQPPSSSPSQNRTEVDIPAVNIKKESDSDTPVILHMKRPEDNKCPICGDKISGYHYGIYSCESCKGFFKRTVQNKRNERLHCSRDNNCEMTLKSRKHCAACRFRKCISTGMKLEAIREDRQRGGRSLYEGSSEYRRRLLIQIQQQSCTSPTPVKRKRRSSKVIVEAPSSSIPSPSANIVLKEEIQPEPEPCEDSHIARLHETILDMLECEALFLAYPFLSCCYIFGDSEEIVVMQLLHLLNHRLDMIIQWVDNVPFFRELETGDKVILVKHTWLHVFTITYCYYFTHENGQVQLSDGQMFNLDDKLHSLALLDLSRRMKDLAAQTRWLEMDRHEYVLLKLICLLNPDAKGLSQPSRVRAFQERVQDILFEYVLETSPQNVRKGGDLLLRLAEVEKFCFLAREQLLFKRMTGQLVQFQNLLSVLVGFTL